MHRWPDPIDHPVQIAFLRGVLDGLKSRQITFAIHEDYDESLVEKLQLENVTIFRGKNEAEYIELYTDARSVILASRLHAGMLALANGVPAVFVGHDTRTYSFCEMMGIDSIELFSDGAAQQALSHLRAVLSGDVDAFGGLGARYTSLYHGMWRFLETNNLPVAR